MSKKVKVKKSDKTLIGPKTKVPSEKLEQMVKNKKADEKSEKVNKSEKGEKKEKKAKASERASNYNFPKDCTSAKDRKKFRTSVRKKVQSLKDKIASVKDGKVKEKNELIRELKAYKSEVYLTSEKD